MANKQIRFSINATEYARTVKIHEAAHPFDSDSVPVAYTSRGLFRSGLVVHEARLKKAGRVKKR